jgi:oligosaccharyltransferase complex subunit beta
LARDLVTEIGVDLELKGTAVIDHVNYVKSSNADHTLLASDNFIDSDAILGNFTQQVTRTCAPSPLQSTYTLS